eukprot:8217151-Alexandrium_andersonii.AAC.1
MSGASKWHCRAMTSRVIAPTSDFRTLASIGMATCGHDIALAINVATLLALTAIVVAAILDQRLIQALPPWLPQSAGLPLPSHGVPTRSPSGWPTSCPR